MMKTLMQKSLMMTSTLKQFSQTHSSNKWSKLWRLWISQRKWWGLRRRKRRDRWRLWFQKTWCVCHAQWGGKKWWSRHASIWCSAKTAKTNTISRIPLTKCVQFAGKNTRKPSKFTSLD
jgi:hypothetical protein